MSKVAEELIKLKEKREVVRKNIEDLIAPIKSLKKQKSECEEKIKVLKTKKSGLAKMLIQDLEKELKQLNKTINFKEEEKTKLEVSLNEIENKIHEREDDTTLYIQEQSNLIVDQFMTFIKNNLREIGMAMKKDYTIEGIIKRVDDRYGDYLIPTGNVGIFESGKREIIAQSEGFYFKNNLYTLNRDDDYEYVKCQVTKWYEEYLEKFVSILLKTLEEKFDYYDFKLTINKPQKSFTLELV